MSVLFLETDRLSQGPLRGWLRRLGLGPIVSARTAKEAWHHVAAQGSALRVILAEKRQSSSEALHLLDQVRQDSTLSQIPFLILDSNLTFRHARSLVRLPRVDGVLRKPFGGTGLFDALSKASFKRRRSRSLVLVLEEPTAACGARVSLALGQRSLWREVVSVASLSELSWLAVERSAELGLVLLSPEAYQHALLRNEPDWLSRFKRSRVARGIPCVSVGDTLEIPKSMRSCCSHFVQPPETVRAAKALVRTLERSVRHQFAVQVHLSLGRGQLKAGAPDRAAKHARAAYRLDETRAEALALLGECRLAEENPRRAEAYFRESLRLNPYRPHAHVRLIDLIRRPTEVEPIRRQAALFCPEHPGVIRAALLAGAP